MASARFFGLPITRNYRTRIVLHGWHVTRVQAEVRQIGQPPQQRIVIDFELAGFPAPFQAALHFER